MRDDPVIIVGMHNSGTSLLTRIAAKGGVFVVQDMNHAESKLISMDLNDDLIMAKDWARDPIMSLDEVEASWDRFSAYLDEHLEDYFMQAGYDGSSSWGFKDPRICVLLPWYLRYFPKASIVHIHRKPEMVAVSIAKEFKHGRGRHGDQQLWRSLQQQHVERVRAIGVGLGGRFYELSYESLCENPLEVTNELFSHLSLSMSSELEAYLQDQVYRDRVDRSHLIESSEQGVLSRIWRFATDAFLTALGRFKILRRKLREKNAKKV